MAASGPPLDGLNPGPHGCLCPNPKTRNAAFGAKGLEMESLLGVRWVQGQPRVLPGVGRRQESERLIRERLEGAACWPWVRGRGSDGGLQAASASRKGRGRVRPAALGVSPGDQDGEAHVCVAVSSRQGPGDG